MHLDVENQPGLTPSLSSVLSGSHHALQQAYIELKRRLNDKTLQNQQLIKRIQELEAAQNSLAGSFDMMEDNSSVREGAVGDPQTAAEEGYVHMLRRELDRSKKQIQHIEKTFQESMQQQESRYNALAQKLQETEARLTAVLCDKDSLQQALDRERGHTGGSVQELREKCQQLEAERDKAVQESLNLTASLKKSQQELHELREKLADGGSVEAPPEMFTEVAHLRRVINSLKRMVLDQRECLAKMENRSSMSMRTSLNRSLRDAASTVEQDMSPPSSNRSCGANSAQSWELVNGTAPQSSLDAHKQRGVRTEQQQPRSHAGGQAMGAATSIYTPIPHTVPSHSVSNGTVDTGGLQAWSKQDWGVHNMPTSHNKMASQNNMISSQNVPASHNMIGGQNHNGSSQNTGPAPVPRRASSEVIRRSSDENMVERRSRTEMIRSPQQLMPADWMGNQANRFPPQSASGQQYRAGPKQPTNPYGQGVSGGGGLPSGPVSPVRTATQPLPSQYPTSQPEPCYQPHMAAGREPTGAYDNVHYVNGNANNVALPGTSLHILNQGVMTGGRVVTSADNYSGYGNTPTSTHVQAPEPAALGRDGAHRTVPQEHSDLNMRSRTLSPGPLDLMPPETPDTRPSENRCDDRRCPVCNQDFSHISMDEFQTHVFDCFDDAEESIGPETLQPPMKTDLGSTDRVCPMCNNRFDDDVSQQLFETHVQSHFEEADPFEVLNIQ